MSDVESCKFSFFLLTVVTLNVTYYLADDPGGVGGVCSAHNNAVLPSWKLCRRKREGPCNPKGSYDQILTTTH